MGGVVKTKKKTKKKTTKGGGERGRRAKKKKNLIDKLIFCRKSINYLKKTRQQRRKGGEGFLKKSGKQYASTTYTGMRKKKQLQL